MEYKGLKLTESQKKMIRDIHRVTKKLIFTKRDMDKDIKNAKTLTEAMILAESSGYSRKELSSIFMTKIKQIRKSNVTK